MAEPMIVDKSGQPRSDEDIQEAIDAITNDLIKGKPRPIMVVYPIILEGLKELLARRNL